MLYGNRMYDFPSKREMRSDVRIVKERDKILILTQFDSQCQASLGRQLEQ